LESLTFTIALILGIVEGLTEFIPVSSTGHLIVAGSLLGYSGSEAATFEIVIQAGAILAVCWEFRARFVRVLQGAFSDHVAQRFIVNLVIAFLPAALIGLLLHKVIAAHLFAPVPVAAALIVGALAILWAERRQKTRPETVRVHDVDAMTPLDALKIGIAQACALIPGMSRSGATIIGGMLFGLARPVATEFSFFLAVPTLLGATVYALWKDASLLSAERWPLLAVGFMAAFVSAFVCVRWLIRYVSRHDFTPFAWYRIAFGLVILVTAQGGLVRWS
jgi:undecaprenyl-diphosphatase